MPPTITNPPQTAHSADSPSSSRSPAQGSSVDIRQLGARLREIALLERTVESATSELLQLVQALTGAESVLYFPLDGNGQLAADPLTLGRCPLAEQTLNQLFSFALSTQSARQPQVAKPHDGEGQLAIAVPVLATDRGTEVLLAIVPAPATDSARISTGVAQVLQFLAAHAACWRGQAERDRIGQRAVQVRGLLQAMAQAALADRFPAAVGQLADSLSTIFDCSLVAIGLQRRTGTCRLVGISHQQRFTDGTDLTRALEEVLSEALIDPLHSGDALTAVRNDAREAVRQAADTNHLVTLTLPDRRGRPRVACLLARKDPSPPDDDLITLCRSMLGEFVLLLRRGRLRWWQRAYNIVDQWSSRQRRAALVAMGVAVGMLTLVPLPYSVKSSCELQPATRRYVAAPYEGRLEKAFVEPGDWVEQGDTIARMDAHEIRLELAAMEADLQRAMKQRDAAMAQRDTAASQLAQLEMERLTLNQQLLTQRMEKLDLKSPTAGVVISGHPKRLEGSRLTMGQTLAEVGPLGSMTLELQVPDTQVSRVTTGALVRFRLESLPGSQFTGTVKRIHPRAEQHDGHNVFVADVQLDEINPLMRPGMRGRARITAASHSLGWILFHRVWERILFRWG